MIAFGSPASPARRLIILWASKRSSARSVSTLGVEGVEALHMTRKGQVKRLDGSDAVGQAKLVAGLFNVAA